MEVKSIERERSIKIDTENGAVLLSYSIKMKLIMQNKELEISETFSQQLVFDYTSEEAIKQLASIEHMMYELDRKADEFVNKVKEIFLSLEQVIENHGYKVI